MNDEILTKETCAEFLKISLPSLDKAINEQALPVHKFGSRALFLKSEVIEWVKGL